MGNTIKIAVITDIHSNLEALNAVISECKDCNEIISLGDVCHFGADTDECFKLLRGLDNFSMVKGNHDAYSNSFYENGLKQNLDGELKSYVEYMYEKTDLSNQQYIKNLPYVLYRNYFGIKIAFLHFSWMSSIETSKVNCLPLPDIELETLFDKIEADYVFFGHTHFPQDSTIKVAGKEKRFINFGPLGTPHKDGNIARYGIIEIDSNKLVKINSFKTTYNVDLTIDKIKKLNHPFIPFILKKFYDK